MIIFEENYRGRGNYQNQTYSNPQYQQPNYQQRQQPHNQAAAQQMPQVYTQNRPAQQAYNRPPANNVPNTNQVTVGAIYHDPNYDPNYDPNTYDPCVPDNSEFDFYNDQVIQTIFVATDDMSEIICGHTPVDKDGLRDDCLSNIYCSTCYTKQPSLKTIDLKYTCKHCTALSCVVCDHTDNCKTCRLPANLTLMTGRDDDAHRHRNQINNTTEPQEKDDDDILHPPLTHQMPSVLPNIPSMIVKPEMDRTEPALDRNYKIPFKWNTYYPSNYNVWCWHQEWEGGYSRQKEYPPHSICVIRITPPLIVSQ